MFIALANALDLFDGFQKLFHIQGKGYVLLQSQGQCYVIENRCPHMDAPLFGGVVLGDSLRCKAHGIVFSLTTGKAEGSLREVLPCLKSLPVVFDGDRVGVDWPSVT